jgi:hypothetical protein
MIASPPRYLTKLEKGKRKIALEVTAQPHKRKGRKQKKKKIKEKESTGFTRKILVTSYPHSLKTEGPGMFQAVWSDIQSR